MREFWQDLRYAFRSFSKCPGLALTAMLSMAAGIGANTSIYSVASALLLHQLPYPNPDRLVLLWNRSPGLDITQDWFSTAQYFDIRNGHSGFEQVAIAIGGNFNLTESGEPERVPVARVSSNLLPMMGARPALGRLFTAREDSPGSPATAVLTYGMWTRRFGGDRRVIGKTLVLNGQPYEVAGVLSRSFSLPIEVLPTLGGAEDAGIFLPLPLAPAASTVRTGEDYNIIGRLRRGVPLSRAQAEMDTITARLRRDFPNVYPPNGGLTFGIVPLQEQVVGETRRPLLILLGSVAFVLLIACANVANLLLSRSVARRKEIAVRLALGAGQGRIVRQLLSESVLLAAAGGALGSLLSVVGVRWLHVLGARSVPRLATVSVNGEALLFTAAISLLSGILFGLAPALRARKVDLHTSLKEAGRGSGAGSPHGGTRLRKLLVVAEMALSLILLIGAGLLLRSFVRLGAVAPGFNPKGVLTFGLTMSGRKYDKRAAVVETYRQLWERLREAPGITAAGGVSALPLSALLAWGPITVEGRTPPPGEKFLNADVRIAAADYFQSMQIPLRSGRFFTDQDTPDKPRVILVDEYMAQQLWPDQDPLGKRVRPGGADSKGPWNTVVGVVGRIKQYALEADSRIAFYMPHTQAPIREMSVTVRSDGSEASAVATVRQIIRSLDRDLPVYQVRGMEKQVAESLARRRFSAMLVALFAGMALLLAAVGIYGVMAYLVSQSTREIGLRLALGSSPGGILRLVMSRSLAISLSGIGIGLAGALALTRFLRSLVFGVGVTDPLTFVSLSLLLAGIAMLASFVPARRAARVDPMASLRHE